MATVLRPSDFRAGDRVTIHPLACDGAPLGFGTNAARRFERTCHILALLIDVSLTWVFLLTGVMQAAFLLFMVAGQTLS
jgi:hypothetical protein